MHTVHGAGQIGLLAAVALFGVDYFTSFFYGTGEMMQRPASVWIAKMGVPGSPAVIASGQHGLWRLYMYSLGIFNEGGGSYTASMRYLCPALSLVVAVVLIQDYTLTIVVSALSGRDQLLSILNLYGTYWWLHFALGASLAGGNLVSDHPRARRISACGLYLAGCFCHVDHCHGDWLVHCEVNGVAVRMPS